VKLARVRRSKASCFLSYGNIDQYKYSNIRGGHIGEGEGKRRKLR
jgi:hypothetical protein